MVWGAKKEDMVSEEAVDAVEKILAVDAVVTENRLVSVAVVALAISVVAIETTLAASADVVMVAVAILELTLMRSRGLLGTEETGVMAAFCAGAALDTLSVAFEEFNAAVGFAVLAAGEPGNFAVVDGFPSELSLFVLAPAFADVDDDAEGVLLVECFDLFGNGLPGVPGVCPGVPGVADVAGLVPTLPGEKRGFGSFFSYISSNDLHI